MNTSTEAFTLTQDASGFSSAYYLHYGEVLIGLIGNREATEAVRDYLADRRADLDAAIAAGTQGALVQDALRATRPTRPTPSCHYCGLPLLSNGSCRECW